MPLKLKKVLALAACDPFYAALMGAATRSRNRIHGKRFALTRRHAHARAILDAPLVEDPRTLKITLGPTGFHTLDKALGGGLRKGEVIVIAGNECRARDGLVAKITHFLQASGIGVDTHSWHGHTDRVLRVALRERRVAAMLQGEVGIIVSSLGVDTSLPREEVCRAILLVGTAGCRPGRAVVAIFRLEHGQVVEDVTVIEDRNPQELHSADWCEIED